VSIVKVLLSRRNRILLYNSYILLILISVVISGVTVVLHWKINFQKRAARVIWVVTCIHHPLNYLKTSIGKHSQSK